MSHDTAGMMQQPVPPSETLIGLVRILAEIAVDDYLNSVNEGQDEPTTTKNHDARRSVRSV